MAEYYPVYSYKKYYKDGENSGQITGTILLLNSTPNILVVDIDNKGTTTSDRQQLCDDLINIFVPTDTSNVYVERTANYGLHIILTNDLDMTDVSKNRWCNIYQGTQYALDIFVCANTESRSCLMITKPHADNIIGANGVRLLPRSKVTRAKTKDGKISSMQIISECNNFINSTMTFSQYSQWLQEHSNISITNFQQLITSKQSSEDKMLTALEDAVSDKITLSNTTLQILCECFDNITIHNYSSNDIKTEVSLLPLFRSILCLSSKQCQQIYNYIYEHAKLTENAQHNYAQVFQHTKDTQHPFKDLSILITMIKHHNPTKYNQYKVQLQGLSDRYQYQNTVPKYIADRNNRIDFRTPISYADVFDENEIQKYTTVEDWFADVQQVLMFNTSNNSYYRKYESEYNDAMILQQVSSQEIKDLLLNIKINNIDPYDYLIRHRRYIQYKDIKMMSDKPNVFSYFCGFCYEAVQNDEVVQPYLTHIKEIIANNDDILYNYIMNWLAHLIQKPVDKVGTSLVIIGGCGTGKGIFVQPILKLLGYYADKVSDIDCVTGQFNPILEGKHLLVCDEVTQQHDTIVNKNNFDKFKTLITEKGMQINQKNEKVRSVKNALNFIMLTNHDKPVVLEQDDRRYFICRTNTKKNHEYYKRLGELYKKDEFYQALLYHLMHRDISKFQPQDIPMTDDRRRIIEYSTSALYLFVTKSQLRKAKKSTLLANYKLFVKEYYDNKINITNNLFYSSIMIYYEDDRKTKDRHMLLKPQYYQEFDDDYAAYLMTMAIDEVYQNDDENRQLMDYRDTCVIDEEVKSNIMHLESIITALM